MLGCLGNGIFYNVFGCYVQDKVRPGTGREGALGYERYAAGAGMRRSGFFQIGTVSWMCGAIVSILHGLFSLAGLKRCVINNAPVHDISKPDL